MATANGGTETKSMKIALPDEVPPPPDLSSLPTHILHSGTVETLIGQNDDLMARLKINVRRNSVLEQQIMEQERINGELTRINGTLTAQIQVFQEKDSGWRDKAATLESLRVRLQKSERENSQLRLALRYVERVRNWVRPMIERMKRDLTEERKTRLSRETQVSDLKARLNDIILKAQNSEKKFTRDQTKLVDQYETQQRALQAELAKLQAESKLFRDKAHRADELIAKTTDLENKMIRLERMNQELEAETSKCRVQATTANLQLAENQRTVEAAKKEAAKASEERDRVQDQFDSLQAVWAETKRRLEAMTVQYQQLNDLNFELSRQLKEQTREKANASE